MQVLINSLLQRIDRLEKQVRSTQNTDALLSQINQKPNLGVPEEGSVGQVLTKLSEQDGDYGWISLSLGSGQNTFETVNKNLQAYPATLAYSNGNLSTITYDLGSGLSIVKTFNYTDGSLTSITLSGNTPEGIALTKTFVYAGSNLTGVTYSVIVDGGA